VPHHSSLTEKLLISPDATVDAAGPQHEPGVTALPVRWPIPNSIFEKCRAAFEKVATEALAQAS
jgi:hypothetical protein